MRINETYLISDVANFSISRLSEDEILILEGHRQKIITFSNVSLPVIHDHLLSVQIKRHNGVFVPLYLKAEFNDKAVVPIEDPMFFEAFKKAFSSFTNHPKLYKWTVVPLNSISINER